MSIKKANGGLRPSRLVRPRGPLLRHRRPGQVRAVDLAIRSPRIWTPSYEQDLLAECASLANGVDGGNRDVLDRRIEADRRNDKKRVRQETDAHIAYMNRVVSLHEARQAAAQLRADTTGAEVERCARQLEEIDHLLALRRDLALFGDVDLTRDKELHA